MKVYIVLEESADGSVKVTGQSDQLILGTDGQPVMTPFVEMCQQVAQLAGKFAAQYTEAAQAEADAVNNLIELKGLTRAAALREVRGS